ncbi:MAG: PspA/IM30 family protein [Blastocatellia bacterium]
MTMWNRTKRLINSYLDELIERAGSPDREVRQVTRSELARLSELEVQTLASVKMFEKELAEVELKMIGVAERERIERERGDPAAAQSAGRELVALGERRDLLRQQISEGKASAARARDLREDRKRVGEELASETHLTKMRENIAGLDTPFNPGDPASTIEEMRARLGSNRVSENEARLAEAERQFEEEQKRARVEEMLARYKGASVNAEPRAAQEAPRGQTDAPNRADLSPGAPSAESPEPDPPKTLGRNPGPVRPID